MNFQVVLDGKATPEVCVFEGDTMGDFLWCKKIVGFVCGI